MIQWDRKNSPEVNQMVAEARDMEQEIVDLKRRHEDLIWKLGARACPYEIGQIFKAKMKRKDRGKLVDFVKYARVVLIRGIMGEPWYAMTGSPIRKDGSTGTDTFELYAFQDWEPADFSEIAKRIIP